MYFGDFPFTVSPGMREKNYTIDYIMMKHNGNNEKPEYTNSITNINEQRWIKFLHLQHVHE